MYDIEHKFEEVALCVSAGKDGQRHNIALVTGVAIINVFGKGRWEYDSITLQSPIAAEPDTTFDSRHPLFDALVDSIDHECGEKLWEETLEVCQPDPDRQHDLRAAE
jgi:hypothetical protein